MKRQSTWAKLILVAIIGLSGACTTGIYDGQRVFNRFSTVTPTGYLPAPLGLGDSLALQAFNPLTSNWDTIDLTINVSLFPAWTTAEGTDLYSYDFGPQLIPLWYWQSGTGGHFARLRVLWTYQGSQYTTVMARQDALECFFEEYDGQANTTLYMLENCFSHRPEAYIYTLNYREGPASCGVPTVPRTNGHYMLHEVSDTAAGGGDCAEEIVYDHVAEAIDEALILRHYEINHSVVADAETKGTVGNDSSNTCGRQPGADGQCEEGGFFGGHERYLRRVERHAMVYDYPWMPQGKIPSWDPAQTIPDRFRFAVEHPTENCVSFQAGCNGWFSSPIPTSTVDSGVPLEDRFKNGNICFEGPLTNWFGDVVGWHNDNHTLVGDFGSSGFASFDSPSFPLFFLWHNYVNDIWVDYRECPFPLP